MTFGDYEYGSSSFGSQAPVPGNINIVVTDIVVGTTSCTGGCNAICSSIDCVIPISTDVTITWQNTGDTVGTFIPTINVTPPGSSTPTTYTLPQVILAAGNTIPTTFIGINLILGQNSMCISPE